MRFIPGSRIKKRKANRKQNGSEKEIEIENEIEIESDSLGASVQRKGSYRANFLRFLMEFFSANRVAK